MLRAFFCLGVLFGSTAPPAGMHAIDVKKVLFTIVSESYSLLVPHTYELVHPFRHSAIGLLLSSIED